MRRSVSVRPLTVCVPVCLCSQNDGHDHVGMGMAYGTSLQADTSLHTGCFSAGNCFYGQSVDAWGGVSGLSYTGGYHWPIDGDGPSTGDEVSYSRFKRVGDKIFQWYKKGPNGDHSFALPEPDEWVATTSYPHMTTLPAGSGVIVLAGEASSPSGEWTGSFTVMPYPADA